MKKIAIYVIILGVFLISFSVAGATNRSDDNHQEVALQDEGNAVRGGLLYDRWWTVIQEHDEEMDMDHEEGDTGEEHEHEHEEDAGAPEGDQPLWATQDTNTRSGPDTWRCVECHGWDYKGADGVYGSGDHFTGFPGVMSSVGQPVEDLVAVLSGSTNPDHDFTAYMEEDELVDLATFLSEGLIDPETLLNDDNTSAGDTSNGETLFTSVCIHCHGPGGNAINFEELEEPEFLAHIATENPWELIHKVRFGAPGWPMPSAITNGWSEQDVSDVLAYVQTFSTEAALSGGGQLYDNWPVLLDADELEGDQPLWATQDTNTRSGADTWRCKECHGWDYRGAEGAYGSGSHMTGFTGVADAASMSEDEVMGWLDGTANPDHDFSAYMDEGALNALVVFLQQEAPDMTAYINDDGTVNGDPGFGRDFFSQTCAACHGVDGAAMNFGSEDEPEYLGTIAAENPWELYHTASFGHPGVPMPAARALGWSEQDIADVLAYIQTLPKE